MVSLIRVGPVPQARGPGLRGRTACETADDGAGGIALAAAGAAIANARRFAESEQRRRWLDASAELTLRLLSGAAGPPDALITEYAAVAAEADFAALTVPHGPDQVIVAGVTGELTEE